MKKFNIDFMGKKKVFWLVALTLIVLGIIISIILPPSLDIQFTGGAIFKYAYSDKIAAESDDVSGTDVSAADAALPSGTSAADISSFATSAAPAAPAASDADVSATNAVPAFDLSTIVPDYSMNIDTDEAGRLLSMALGENVTCSVSSRINIDDSDAENKNFVVSLNKKVALGHEADATIKAVMAAKYPNININLKESNSVNPAMGREFFWKCMVAVILACGLIILYIALRFRKVGGFTAALCAIAAILHDCAMVFFAFVVCRFPLDDNFIAVILTVVGYSINSTIIIFDRVRENRRVLGPKATVEKLVNTSLNDTLGRTINTNLTLLFAVLTVVIVTACFNISSIMSFAIPMLIGVIAGTFSSVCIAPSLWATWREAIDTKNSPSTRK